MQDAYTAKEIAQAIPTGMTDRAIRKRADLEGWPFSAVPQGKGRPVKTYKFASLPADVREALARVAASEAASAGRHEALRLKMDAEARSSGERRAASQGLARFACLGEKARSRADAKLALLAACAEFVRAHALPKKRGRELFVHQYNSGEIVVDAAIRAMIPKTCANTLDNWDKRLRQGSGLAGLAGNYGRHRLGTGVIDSNADLHDLVLGLIAQYPDCSPAFVMEAIKVRFPGLRLSERNLQRWMKEWKRSNPRLIQDLQSPDTCRSRFQPADGSRTEGIVRLNQRWELDSTKGDVMLNVDGTRTRHMIVACLDVYSRRVKFLVSRSSSSAAVAALLRRCMLDWGVPEEIGTDNGTDFISNHIQRIALSLDIARDVAPPFTPEHKPFVERVFKTFLHGLFEGLQGYIGHSVAQRKAIEDRKAFAKRVVGAWRKGEGDAPVELLMDPDQLQAFCDEWSDAIYAHKPHSGDGMNGRTPWQKAAGYSGQVRRIPDERALDVLLSPVAGKNGWREISKKGIRVDKFKYTSPLLGGHEGQSVLVLEDASDWGAIHVFLPGDSGEPEYLCRAECPEILGTSRRDAALARKRVYTKIRNEERAAMRARAKKVGAEDILREVREHNAAQAGKLTHLPQPSIPHETEALRQAGLAARATDGPAPAPADQAREMRELAARELARPAVVHQMPETPQQRYRRWQRLDDAQRAGAVLGEADSRWWRNYQLGSEFRSMRDLDLFYGAGAQSV